MKRLENMVSGVGFISWCHVSEWRCLYPVENFDSMEVPTLRSLDPFETLWSINDMIHC